MPKGAASREGRNGRVVAISRGRHAPEGQTVVFGCCPSVSTRSGRLPISVGSHDTDYYDLRAVRVDFLFVASQLTTKLCREHFRHVGSPQSWSSTTRAIDTKKYGRVTAVANQS